MPAQARVMHLITSWVQSTGYEFDHRESLGWRKRIRKPITKTAFVWIRQYVVLHFLTSSSPVEVCFTCFFTTYHDPKPLSHFLLKVMAARTYLKQSFISWLLVFKRRREDGSEKVRTPNFVASCTPMWLQVWHSCSGTCPCRGRFCLQYSDQLNQESEASSTNSIGKKLKLKTWCYWNTCVSVRQADLARSQVGK